MKVERRGSRERRFGMPPQKRSEDGGRSFGNVALIRVAGECIKLVFIDDHLGSLVQLVLTGVRASHMNYTYGRGKRSP